MKGRKRLDKKKRRKGLSKKESLYGILFALVSVSILFIYFLLYSPLTQTSGASQFKAAIVDHLSLTSPNEAFVQTAINILTKARYVVDYYPGEDVNVEFYRNLPTHGHSLIIFRVHSGLLKGMFAPLCLFTSELYSKTKYVYEQSTDRIGPVSFTAEPQKYFGILPNFIQLSMNGRFKNAAVIMMGCNGLTYTEMAQAFIDKGAKVYISWSEEVSISHTDQATLQLLEHLITENQRIKEAVNEISPDPTYDSKLDYYPKTAQVENYVIPEPESNLTTNVAQINPKMQRLKDEY